MRSAKHRFLAPLALVIATAIVCTGVAAAGLVPNGDFQNGLANWTAVAPVAVVATQGTCFSAFNTKGITLPGGKSLLIRSPGGTNGTGVLTSDPLPVGRYLSFDALQETNANSNPDPATFNVAEVLNAVSNDVLIGPVNIEPNLWTALGSLCLSDPFSPDGVFSHHTIDTRSITPGTSVKIRFTQHTNLGNAGFFTLVDNVSVAYLEADAGGAYSGDEGSSISIAGTASSEAGDSVTTSWSATPMTADPGATCSFGDAAALATTVSCTDDGEYKLTLTADDGGPTSATSDATLTVANVPPTITAVSASATQTLTSTQVTFTGSATDPSALDTTAGFRWRWKVDGGTYSALGSPGGNTFSASFPVCGTHTVTAQAEDKDDGASEPFTSGSVSAYTAHFLQPLDEGKLNLVQTGRVVPVKVSIGCSGVPLTGLAPGIQLLNGDQSAGNETASDEIETFSSSAADTTGVMRPADSMYIYNLQVPSAASVGSLFTIRVRPFGTGADLRVVLKIRK